MQENDSRVDILEKSVSLSLIEVFLGSFLHLFKIPLSGHFLSLNQGGFLSRLVKKENRIDAIKNVVEVSTVVAVMKSFAPTSKKLGPMISISMQGWLYALGILVLGTNLIGQILGMIFLSLWAFLQPLVTYFLLFGTDFAKAILYFVDKINDYFHWSEQTFWYFVTALVVIKVLIAVCIPILLNFKGEVIFERFEKMLVFFVRQKGVSRKQRKGILSHINIGIILSFIMMIFFLKLNGTENSIVFWKAMRSLAILLALIFVGRAKWVQQWMVFLSQRSAFMKRLYETGQGAMRELSDRL